MEKTSKEYAEKWADSLYPKRTSETTIEILLARLSKRNGRIEGYLKAVEETNAKGMLEALEKARKDLKKWWSILDWEYFDAITGIDEAIRKAKEVNNG